MKRLAFIFAFLIVCSAIQANARGIMTMAGAGVPVAGGITYDNLTAAVQANANHDYNHAQGSLTNGVVILLVGWMVNTATEATATYGGSEMTLIEQSTGTGGGYTSIFKLDLGTSASGNKAVTVTFNGTMYRSNAICITYSGVAQDTTFTDGGVTNAYNAAPTITLATTTGSRMISVTRINSSTYILSSPSGTELYNFSGQSNNHGVGVQWAAGTGGNVTLSWASQGNAYNSIAGVVITPSP